jgi:hypothetical protein
MIRPAYVEGSDGRFVERIDRGQATLFPECLEDWIGPIRWGARDFWAVPKKLQDVGSLQSCGNCGPLVEQKAMEHVLPRRTG